jgi:nucleotide-binding universal stress UspA family protein
MKKILVPVDFSEHSEYAMEVAAQLAKKYGAEIVTLHMMGLSETIITKDDSQEALEAIYYMKLTEKRFREFLDRDYLKGIKITSTVQNYKIFNEMDDLVKEHEADLIVMGSHGSSGVREVFVGSNTEKVVRTSSVPVLVIKNRIMNFTVNKMVFASDFSPEYIPAFKKVKELAKMFDSSFQWLYINTPERFMRSSEMTERAFKFLTQAEDGDIDLHDSIQYYCDKTIEEGIFTFSSDYNTDVIAIPTRGRRGLAHFFAGSLGEELVNHSDIPIITFKI